MALIDELHQRHVAVRAKWDAMAVPDDGIDLRRRPKRELKPETEPTVDAVPLLVTVSPDSIPDDAPVKRRPLTIRTTVEDIQCVVARKYNFSRADLLSHRRTLDVVRARHIAMFLCRELTRRSLPEIGRRFGGRDHTTVLNSIRRVTGWIETQENFGEELDGLRRELNREGLRDEDQSR